MPHGTGYDGGFSSMESVMDSFEAITARSFVRSSFDLAEQYEFLESLNSSEMDELVKSENEKLRAIRNEINSDLVERSKLVMIIFHYITRFMYNIHFSYERYDDGYNARVGFINNFKGMCGDKLSSDLLYEFNHFAFNRPLYERFFFILKKGLNTQSFYTQVRFLCEYVGGIRVPKREDVKLEDWLLSERILESEWSWEYEKELKSEENMFFIFRSQKKIEKIKDRWNSRRVAVQNFKEEIKEVFPYLCKSNRLLIELKNKELNLSVSNESLNRAYNAIKEGVKLKHLLLEDKEAYMIIAKALK